MTERVVRGIASDYQANDDLRERAFYEEEEGSCHCLLCVRLDCALAEPPDLVELLRWLVDRKDEGEVVTLENIKAFTEDEFGVRLTDDSWEWVE